MMWNEYIYNGKTIRYTYNHAGDRIVKSHGDLEGVYINGAPQGITFHENDEFTLYPASIISVNKNRFTKHYFIGSQRVASRIGSGRFNNVYGRNGSYVTVGQQDYAERMSQIESQKEEYYKELGIAPGVPTMKGAYGDHENTGVGYNTIITELGDHSVPEGWIQTPRPNTTPDTEPGAPISWNAPQNPENPDAGYGYIADDTTDEETFFYHSDHLGSTSYITDDKGNVNQYDAYLPYGELLVDEHSSSEEMPYKFNGKELDEETGLYYYGARYMQPVASVWYGVDQLTEEYASVSGYTYCLGNPIKLVDTDGKKVYQGKIQVIYLQNGKLTLSSKASEYTKMLYNGMMKTKTGRKQLLLMVKSPTAIHLEYSSKDTNTKNSVTYADTQQAKQDGSSLHNERIDKLIERLKSDKDVYNIRKNQKQVDIHGNVVGNNRPDVQFDKNGVHTNVEYDTQTRSMNKHKQQVPNNDSQARNKFYKINGK